MNLDNKTLLRYSIIAISIIAIFALINKIYTDDTDTVYGKTETMGNLKNCVTRNMRNFEKDIKDELTNYPDPALCSDFSIQKDRYLEHPVDDQTNIIQDSTGRSMCRCGPGCKCQGMCHCGPNSNCGQDCAFYNRCSTGQCGPQGQCSGGQCEPNARPTTGCLADGKFDNINWDIKYEPGTNGTVSDLVWNYQSPRMTLRCGCLQCKETNKFKMLDAPSGFPDGYVNSARGDNHQYLDKATYASPNDSSMMYDKINTPIIDGQTMSTCTSRNSTGIVPRMCDCVDKNVQNSYKCTDGIASGNNVKIYNFHK